MNKIIVFVDIKQANINKFYGLGLGSMIKSTSSYLSMNKYDQDEFLKVGKGDRVMLVGKEAYDIFKSRYHMGVRGENSYDISLLKRLGLHNGCFVRVIHKVESDNEIKYPTMSEINYFLSDDFISTRDYSYFKQVVVHSYSEALPFLDYFYNSNEDLGFDYETNGMPLEKDFMITGASLSDSRYGCFFSWIDIKRNSSPEEFNDFKNRFKLLLLRNQSRLWAYNLQFEQQVSFREFGIDIEICDTSVYNILDAYHSKKYSLKYSIQRLLPGTLSWDRHSCPNKIHLIAGKSC